MFNFKTLFEENYFNFAWKNYNLVQNILSKMSKLCKIGEKQRTMITFSMYKLTTITKVFSEGEMGNRQFLNQILTFFF